VKPFDPEMKLNDESFWVPLTSTQPTRVVDLLDQPRALLDLQRLLNPELDLDPERAKGEDPNSG